MPSKDTENIDQRAERASLKSAAAMLRASEDSILEAREVSQTRSDWVGNFGTIQHLALSLKDLDIGLCTQYIYVPLHRLGLCSSLCRP